MDHARALRTAAAERYVLGELTPEEHAEFEQHFFDCRECAADVETLVAIGDEARAMGFSGDAAAPSSSAAATGRTLLRGRWRRVPLLLPAAAVLAIAGGFAVYQAVVTVPRLRAEIAHLSVPQASSWHFLAVARGAPVEIRVPAHQHWVGLTLSRSDPRPFAAYRLEVRDELDAPVLVATLPAPPTGEELQLLLPVTGLEPSAYTIVVSGRERPDGPVVAPAVARYSFVLSFEEGP